MIFFFKFVISVRGAHRVCSFWASKNLAMPLQVPMHLSLPCSLLRLSSKKMTLLVVMTP